MKVLILALVAGLVSLSSFSAQAIEYADEIPASLKTQLTSDMGFLQSLSGSGATQLYKQIYGGEFSGPRNLAFFSTRIFRFDLDDCGGGGSVAACAAPDHVMSITENYIKLDIPQFERISILIHESRHTEAAHNGWPHVTCPVPFLDESGNEVKGIVSGLPLAGQPACDITALGAYGVQAEFLKNAQFFCANCNDKTKMDAQIFGDDTLKRIVDSSAASVLKSDLAH